MSISYYDKSGDEPVKVLLAGTSATDLLLDPNSTNAIANRAVYVALSEKIDVTVRNLLYYYTKEQVFTKEEVQDLLATLSTMDIRVVSDLPTTDISTNTIYFLESALTEGVYDQYVYVQGAWVKIGDTDVDLSDYLKNEDFVIRIADYYTKTQINSLITDYYTKTQVDNFLADKQDKLTFDSTPTTGSNNPVTSKGIKAAIDAVKGGSGSNPNILDNPFFQINQNYGSGDNTSTTTQFFAGSTYNNKLTVDRWWHRLGGTASVSHYKNTGTGPKIVINSSGQWGRLEQFIPKEVGDQLIGKNVVMSAIVSVPGSKGVKIRLRFGRCKNGVAMDTSGDWYAQDFDVPAGANHRLIVSSPKKIVSTSNDYGCYDFLIYPQFSGGSTARTGENVHVHAVKLEISDSGSTLAKDPIPNYEEDLLKCLRWRYIIRGINNNPHYFATGYPTNSSTIQFFMNLPVKMYRRPTAIFGSANYTLFKPGGVSSTLSSASFNNITTESTISTMFSFTSTGGSSLNSGEAYLLGTTSASNFLELSCEGYFSSM